MGKAIGPSMMVGVSCLLGVVATGCQGPLSDDSARSAALDLVPSGKVLLVSDGEGAQPEKLVFLEMQGGGGVELRFFAESGRLHKAESGRGPFEYDIRFPDVLSYAEAYAHAVAAKPGTTEAWNHDAVDLDYEFYLRDATQHLFEVKLSAKDGVVVSILPKEMVD